MPSVTLKNQIQMPLLGFGVLRKRWQDRDSKLR